MRTISAPRRSQSGRLAITTVFFVSGLVYTSFYARLPAIQAHLDLRPGALGLALLGAPAGLLVAQPLVGAVVTRRGSRPVVALTPLLVLTAVLPALAVDVTSLFLAVLAVGASNGALDIAMNAQGLAVENAAGRRLFASLHAALSFGALGGAALAAVAAALGIPVAAHLALVAGAGALVARASLRGLPASHPPAASVRFARPSRPLALLGAIAFCALLAEGAMFDWASIYLARELHTTDGAAALGLAAFLVTMGAGRLAADTLAGRFGGAAVARASALLAAAGLAAALATTNPVMACAGLAVMGLGLSALFPLTLHATRSQPAAGPALAAVSTLGYTGFLAGPPTIGLLAETSSLHAALGLVCAMCLVAAALTRTWPDTAGKTPPRGLGDAVPAGAHLSGTDAHRQS
jgi:MFS family permease